MTELKGWTGKILRVDLSTGDISTTDTARYVPEYVGGMGIAARIAWEELKPGIDAFDPENVLFLMVGPLTGTMASGGGRVLVAGIAPQQRPSIFSRSGMGGHWGAELKYAGFDGVVIKGRSDKPVYLWVHDGKAEIKDASHLWGTGTYGTTQTLRANLGRRTRIVSIGPAGENMSRIACLQTETGNTAGQGGFGGLMGSKNLKAVAVRGTMGVGVAEPERMMDICLRASREGQSPARPGLLARQRRRPDEGIKMRAHKCGFCITPCANRLAMDVPATETTGTVNASYQCWGFRTASMREHTELRAMVADLGINGWEFNYGIIPWLQMCRQHGLIDSIDGLEIPVPDHPVVYNRDSGQITAKFGRMLLRKIAYQEDDLARSLSKGACYAGYELFGGKGAPLLDYIYPRHWGQTNHWNGHWGTGGNIYFPFWLTPILQWCVDVRDPASDSTHQYAEHFLQYIPKHGPHEGPLDMETARAVCAAVYGEPDACNPEYTYDKPDTKAKPAIFHHNRGMIVESLVLCDREHTRVFSQLSPDKKADTALMSRLFSAATGFETSEEVLDRAGDRVFNMIRAIDIRNHDRCRDVDWQVAEGLTHPAFTDGVQLDLEQFGPMLNRYYELRGWNPENGYPTREHLSSLGLDDVADELESLGKLG